MSHSLVDSLEDALTMQSVVADSSVNFDGNNDSDREPEIDAECLAMMCGDRLNTNSPALATVAFGGRVDRRPECEARTGRAVSAVPDARPSPPGAPGEQPSVLYGR